MPAVDAFSTNLDQWMHAMGEPLETLVRLLLAALAGGAIGFEREVRGRKAGLRTHMLVAIGSALAMIVSIQVAYHDWSGISEQVLRMDPARIAYGVMAGVGFLGAGAIMRREDAIRGLTTAAAIWCVAALGLAAGLGLYLITLLATLLILVVLTLVAAFERQLPNTRYRQFVVRVPDQLAAVEEVRKIASTKFRFANHLNWQKSAEPGYIDVTLRVVYWNRHDLHQIETTLESTPSVRLISSVESD